MKSTAAVLAAVLIFAACRSGTPPKHEERSSAGDSTIFGDDRARQGNAPRAPEVALLERLIDDYESLDVVQDALSRPSAESPVKGLAWKGDRHEDAAKARLGALLTTEYGERYQPRTPASPTAAADSLASLPGKSGHEALNALVLAQHRRVSAAIAAALPSLTNARVRAELSRLAEDLRQEVARLGGP